jgi:hypothetical protein
MRAAAKENHRTTATDQDSSLRATGPKLRIFSPRLKNSQDSS